MAWHFDEVNDYVTLGDDAALTLPDGDWSLGGLVKLTDNTGSLYQYFLSWGSFAAAPSINIFFREASASDPNGLADIPHIPSKFVEIAPLSHRQGNCIPYAAIRWHDFGNRPALGRPLGHFSRHPDTPLLSLSPRRRFPRPTPERVFVADHQSSSGFSGTGPSAPPPQPIGT